MTNLDISVIILTFNEELHIARCLENIKPIANDIFVVDSFSSDKTVLIAKKMGAKVFQNTFVNHSKQFKWALDNCSITTKWIMRLDADEYLEQPLIEEILNRFPHLDPDISGVYLKRKHYFLGRWIKYGDRYPITLLRLWKSGHGHIEQRWMDEHVVLTQGKSITFKENFVDDNLNNISWFIDKHNRYATREMLENIKIKFKIDSSDMSLIGQSNSQAKFKRIIKTRIYNKLPLFTRPTLYFFYRYVLRLGFLDGAEGFAYHFMQGFWYRCLVDLKCLEAERILKNTNTQEEKIECLAKLTGLQIN